MTDTAPHPQPVRRTKKRSGSGTRKRSLVVRFRATEDERAAIATDAERAGLTVGSYIRTRLLTAPETRATRRLTVERRLLAQLLGQLGRVGGNMHQITKHLNFGERITHAELQTALAEFRDAAHAIMQTLGKRPHDH